MYQLTAAMVGMLGGPALQVLMVLRIERAPRSLGFLVDMTNLSDKTASQAVRKLITLGMIHQTGRYIYQIAAGVTQLPLGETPVFPDPQQGEIEADVENAVDKPVDKPVDNQADEELGRKISDLALNVNVNECMNESINQESFIHSCDDGTEIPICAEPTRENLSMLGFYGRGLEDLLTIPGLTMREVRYNVARAPNLGSALYRLKRRQTVPAEWERAGPDENRSRYISGDFAEFIHH